MNRYERKKLKAKMEKELVVKMDDDDEGPNSICQLPSSILTDILSRLPIKPLIRCRCVCKSFLSIISAADPEFPPLHLSRSPTELIVLSSSITDHIFLVDCDKDYQYHKLNLPRFDGSDAPEALNSCRGLLCFDLFFSSRTLFVLNPVTLEYILIPPPIDFIDITKPHTLHFGLGYSPMTDKYKAIVMIHYQTSDNITTSTTTATAVYTLGSPSGWRSIEEDAPVVVFNTSFPVYLNGSLHWIVQKKNNTADCILFFDFDNENFGEIEMPPPFKAPGLENQLETHVANLCVFEGQLSVCLLIDQKKINVWVMKQYGISRSWSKEIVAETLNQYLWSPCTFPLKYVKDKKAVVLGFMDDQILVTYHLIEKKFINFNELIFNGGILKPLMHVPILMPLKDLIVGAEVHLITEPWHKWKKWDKKWLINLVRARRSKLDHDSDSYVEVDSDFHANLDSDPDYDVDADVDSDYDDDSE